MTDIIETDNDLFTMSLPTVEPDGKLQPAVQVDAKPANVISDFFKDNIMVTSIIILSVVILFIALFLILKKLFVKRNPMTEYTKQQTKKIKQEQAYVSSSNKLETPENIVDCIRAFIERTK